MKRLKSNWINWNYKAPIANSLWKNDHLLWKLLYEADHRDAATCNDYRSFIKRI